MLQKKNSAPKVWTKYIDNFFGNSNIIIDVKWKVWPQKMLKIVNHIQKKWKRLSCTCNRDA